MELRNVDIKNFKSIENIELDLDDGIKENYNIFQNIELTQEGKKSKKVNLLKKM